MNLISRPQHALLDAVTVLLFALAPAVLGLEGAAAVLAYVLAVVHLLMTLTTASLPGAQAAVIPLALHGMVEAAVGVVLAVVGLLAFDGTAAGFYVVMGALILLVFVLTAYTTD